ncbi:hypothetical protein ACJX0J_015586 [Zea mays]
MSSSIYYLKYKRVIHIIKYPLNLDIGGQSQTIIRLHHPTSYIMFGTNFCDTAEVEQSQYYITILAPTLQHFAHVSLPDSNIRYFSKALVRDIFMKRNIYFVSGHFLCLWKKISIFFFISRMYGIKQSCLLLLIKSFQPFYWDILADMCGWVSSYLTSVKAHLSKIGEQYCIQQIKKRTVLVDVTKLELILFVRGVTDFCSRGIFLIKHTYKRLTNYLLHASTGIEQGKKTWRWKGQTTIQFITDNCAL